MKAIVTGISGQDGFFLAQLLSKGYEVHDVLTRNSLMSGGTMELQHPEMRKQIVIHFGVTPHENFLSKLLKNERPEEFYHLAAQSFIGYSVENAHSTYDVNTGGTLNVCNAIRSTSPDRRMYSVATSELFGRPAETPQDESIPFLPRSP